ncbi:hypothetical protein KAU11_06130, partial [Candidatus Babeliales bacterium]|nr:hypothetical protein [Candidatus Babeliales bacterium]
MSELKKINSRIKLYLQKNPKKSDKIENPSLADEPESSSPKAVFCIPKFRQLKYIARFLSIKEKLVIKILSGIIIFAIIFLAIRFYDNYLESAPCSGGQYTEAVIGAPQFINPALGVTSDIDKDLTKLIYSGLLKYNKNQELIPDLASNYTISEDQKTYIFYLKKNVLWHDSQPLTADDIIFTIKTIQNPEYKSPLYISFKGVEIEKNDDYTVKFTLEEPFAPFLSILT